jgi:PAS domain S-box-containing protein
MTRLSFANRLRLGLALMLALLGAAYVLALRQAPPDASGLARALSESEARRSALAAMQASADESWAVVTGLLRASGPPELTALEQADQKFAAALKRYAEAGDDEHRKLAGEIEAQHARYRQQAGELLNASPAQQNVASFVDYQARTLRALLADMPEPPAVRLQGRAARKQEAARALQAALRERADYFAQSEASRGPVPPAQDLMSALARYQAFTDTSAERAWAERAARALRDGQQQADAIAGVDRVQREAVEKAEALHAELKAALAQRAQAAAPADLTALLEQTAQGARAANARLADQLLVLAALGLLGAVLTFYAVRAPLRRLAASTRGYASDLSFVTLSSRGDEVAELQWTLSSLIEQAQAERASQGGVEDERMRQAALAFERNAQSMLLTDERLGIVLVNPAFTELTGYALEEVKGSQPALLWSPDHHDVAAVNAVWAQVDESGGWQGEIVVRGKTGELRPVWGVITALRDAHSTLQHALVVLSDRAEMLARDDARHASLVPQPAEARDRIAAGTYARIAEAVQAGGPLAILRLHVDTLRTVGEALGEQEARELLDEVRSRVRQAAGERAEVLDNDTCEPLVLVEQPQDAERVARIAQDILIALSAPARFNALELPVAGAIGIARMPEDADSVDALMESAGAALERARAVRGGALAFTSEALTEQMRDCMALQDELRAPALTEQLVLHYQPLLALRNGKAVAVEALLRWRHPARGLLAPDAFLAQAERMGVLPDIGAWVLRTACAQARRWADSGLPALRVAVNLSHTELQNPALLEWIKDALAQSGLDAQLLQLELREESLAGVPDAGTLLNALQALGVTLTLSSQRDSDGASRALTWLPFTRIKFPAPVHPNDAAQASGSIIALSRSLGVEVVAERIETEAQAAAMRARGVDELQGFLIGRPVAAREFEMRLRHVVGRAPGPLVAADASS